MSLFTTTCLGNLPQCHFAQECVLEENVVVSLKFLTSPPKNLGSWKTVSSFQICATRITKALEYTVYTLASFLYRFIVTYVILKEKISEVHVVEFVSIKTWKQLYISQYRLLIHPMEGWCPSSRAGCLQCPMFAGQSSGT